MVAALIMGAAIRPRPVFVKDEPRHSGMRTTTGILGQLRIRIRAARARNDDRQIIGFHGAGTTR